MSDRVVFVGIDRKGRTSVDRKLVHVCKTMRDQVVWIADAPFTVTFEGKGPFRGRAFRGGQGKPAQTGHAIHSSARPFKYTIQIEGAKPFDPHVGVDE